MIKLHVLLTLFFVILCSPLFSKELKGELKCTIIDPKEKELRCANELCFYDIVTCLKPELCNDSKKSEDSKTRQEFTLKYIYKYFHINNWASFQMMSDELDFLSYINFKKQNEKISNQQKWKKSNSMRFGGVGSYNKQVSVISPWEISLHSMNQYLQLNHLGKKKKESGRYWNGYFVFNKSNSNVSKNFAWEKIEFECVHNIDKLNEIFQALRIKGY